MVTGLNPLIGHEKAASLAKQAFAMGKTIRDLCEERRVMDELVLLQALDPWSMTASQEQPWRFPGPTGKYRPW
jgi:aspartate ammonia-lyase